MFNDRYGLTQAVIDGWKTVTRRTELDDDANYIVRPGNNIYHPQHCYYRDARGLCQLVNCKTDKVFIPRYKLGEIVAVAQSYRDAGYECLPYRDTDEYVYLKRDGVVVSDISVAEAGVTNKMFATAKQMPHRIWITGIRIERLQDISDEDCLKEGIWKAENVGFKGTTYWYPNLVNSAFRTPREAFAALIDKVSGKGTWNRNPFVVVYEFEVIK